MPHTFVAAWCSDLVSLNMVGRKYEKHVDSGIYIPSHAPSQPLDLGNTHLSESTFTVLHTRTLAALMRLLLLLVLLPLSSGLVPGAQNGNNTGQLLV